MVVVGEGLVPPTTEVMASGYLADTTWASSWQISRIDLRWGGGGALDEWMD